MSRSIEKMAKDSHVMAASAGFAIFHHTPRTDLFGTNKSTNLMVDIAKQLSINQASTKLC